MKILDTHWSHQLRQDKTNGILAKFQVPLCIYPTTIEGGKAEWEVQLLGGDMSEAVEQIHARQKLIHSRWMAMGRAGISRLDALFMYATQWMEWAIVRGPDDPEHERVVEFIDHWFTVYRVLSERYIH